MDADGARGKNLVFGTGARTGASAGAGGQTKPRAFWAFWAFLVNFSAAPYHHVDRTRYTARGAHVSWLLI